MQKVYGYHLFLNDHLVAWSSDLYTSPDEVTAYLQDHVLEICRDIANEDRDAVFDWPEGSNDDFDLNDPTSCEDEDNFKECLKTYNAVRLLFAYHTWPEGMGYELSLYIKEYRVLERYKKQIR